MDKKEFGLFASALRTYYSRENLLPNAQAMELWFRQLQDIPYPVAEAVLEKWVSTNKWSPSISEIRELATEVQYGKLPDWGEGWNEVCKAIGRYGIYRPQEAYDSMKPMTRKVVERLGYTNLCLSENPAADRANFRQCYETVLAREREDSMMPDSLRQMIEGIKSNPQLDAPAENEKRLATVSSQLNEWGRF